MIDLYVVIGIILGFAAGLFIRHSAIKDRDEEIDRLNKELTVKQNICEANNATITRLRKECNRLKGKRQ